MNFSVSQRIVVWLGAGVLAVMVMFPPFTSQWEYPLWLGHRGDVLGARTGGHITDEHGRVLARYEAGQRTVKLPPETKYSFVLVPAGRLDVKRVIIQFGITLGAIGVTIMALGFLRDSERAQSTENAIDDGEWHVGVCATCGAKKRIRDSICNDCYYDGPPTST
jgi:hypothetical protein